MGRVIAIDPGQWSGVAYFQDGLLTRADLVGKGEQNISFYAREILEVGAGTEAVIEIPQVYQQRQWKGDPNDLISVAYIAGIFGAWIYAKSGDVTLIRPHDWKGSRPKYVDMKYTLSCLEETERRVLPDLPKTKLHNVIDAVGIGLWFLQRR